MGKNSYEKNVTKIKPGNYEFFISTIFKLLLFRNLIVDCVYTLFYLAANLLGNGGG